MTSYFKKCATTQKETAKCQSLPQIYIHMHLHSLKVLSDSLETAEMIFLGPPV